MVWELQCHVWETAQLTPVYHTLIFDTSAHANTTPFCSRAVDFITSYQNTCSEICMCDTIRWYWRSVAKESAVIQSTAKLDFPHRSLKPTNRIPARDDFLWRGFRSVFVVSISDMRHAPRYQWRESHDTEACCARITLISNSRTN